jgi:hypothetical protein
MAKSCKKETRYARDGEIKYPHFQKPLRVHQKLKKVWKLNRL